MVERITGGKAMPAEVMRHLVEKADGVPLYVEEMTKDCLLPILRYDDDVVAAIPPDMALVLPCSPWGFSFLWPWRVHTGSNHLPLHASTLVAGLPAYLWEHSLSVRFPGSATLKRGF